MVKKFRKKPVIVEVVQWTGNNAPEIVEFTKGTKQYIKVENDNTVSVGTLEGLMVASLNDYIIKGVQGEFYACKPDIFEQTYEEVDG